MRKPTCEPDTKGSLLLLRTRASGPGTVLDMGTQRGCGRHRAHPDGRGGQVLSYVSLRFCNTWRMPKQGILEDSQWVYIMQNQNSGVPAPGPNSERGPPLNRRQRATAVCPMQLNAKASNLRIPQANCHVHPKTSYQFGSSSVTGVTESESKVTACDKHPRHCCRCMNRNS